VDSKLTYNRVKLPKSFLAVNLSESHTFHKKEETNESNEAIEDKVTMTETEPLAEEESKLAVPEGLSEALQRGYHNSLPST
jgi:inositol hexakisphosphate/diphosphoinositol-pentakisphosphate kinase